MREYATPVSRRKIGKCVRALSGDSGGVRPICKFPSNPSGQPLAKTCRTVTPGNTSKTSNALRPIRTASGVSALDAAAARDDAKDARDAAARNERALTQRDESLARTSKDFEAAATSEIEALK